MRKDLIKRKTIAHYNKMIKWAKKQNPEESTSKELMYVEIKQNWTGLSCFYCSAYYGINDKCFGRCPLSTNEDDYCCDHLWETMDRSRTWREWIENAKKVLDYIKIHG